MPFDQQSFDNFLNYKKLVAANPGKQIIQTMGGFKVAPAGQAGNMNPNNPSGQIFQGYNEHKNPDMGGDQSQGGDTYGPGGLPVPNALGWDSTLYGDQAYWNPTDTLPGGQGVQAYLDQLKNFSWPNFASKPSGTSLIQDYLEGLKSPGIAPVLAAAGIGQLVGGAGGATGAGWTSGYDLAGGGSFSGLGGSNVSIFDSILNDTSGNLLFDPSALEGLGLDLNTFDPSKLRDLTSVNPDGSFIPPETTQSLQRLVDAGLPADMVQKMGQLGIKDLSSLTKLLGSQGGGSALSKFLNGTAGAEDYLSLLGTLGATGAGVYNANQQTNLQKELADRYFNVGAPSRARYEGSFAPGFSMLGDPGYKDALDQTMQSYLRKASTGGNPFENSGVSEEILKGVNASLALPSLQNYRTQNANTGGYSSFNTAAPTAAQSAINSSGNGLTQLFGGLSDLINPQPQTQQQDFSNLLQQFFKSTNGTSL